MRHQFDIPQAAVAQATSVSDPINVDGVIAAVRRQWRLAAVVGIFGLIAGAAYAFTAGDADRERINKSGIHIDFMIGGDEVAVTGLRDDGTEVPVLRGGAWQL